MIASIRATIEMRKPGKLYYSNDVISWKGKSNHHIIRIKNGRPSFFSPISTSVLLIFLVFFSENCKHRKKTRKFRCKVLTKPHSFTGISKRRAKKKKRGDSYSTFDPIFFIFRIFHFNTFVYRQRCYIHTVVHHHTHIHCKCHYITILYIRIGPHL